MGDIFLFIGGIIFIGLAGLSFFDRDSLWNLYSMDRTWRQENPERTPQWDKRAKRFGFGFLVAGIIFMVISFAVG